MNILEEIKNNLNEITKNIELILKIEFENEMNLLRKDDLYFNFYKSLLANINTFEHKNKNGVHLLLWFSEMGEGQTDVRQKNDFGHDNYLSMITGAKRVARRRFPLH